MHDWVQTFTIIGSLLGVTAWLDHKHRQEMDKMDERWKWLFERTDTKLDQIRNK